MVSECITVLPCFTNVLRLNSQFEAHYSRISNGRDREDYTGFCSFKIGYPFRLDNCHSRQDWMAFVLVGCPRGAPVQCTVPSVSRGLTEVGAEKFEALDPFSHPRRRGLGRTPMEGGRASLGGAVSANA